jgi:hypothetical protein
MIVQLDSEVLLSTKLTPNQYTLMYLIYKNRLDLIDVFKGTAESVDIWEAVYSCEEDGWLKYTGESTELDTSQIVLRDKFLDLVESDEDRLCASITSRYPISELRNGQRVYLQKDKKGIRAKILKTVGKDKQLALRIGKCIELHLEDARKAGMKAAWMPDLLVYLNQEIWKNWEQTLDESANSEKEVGYGTRLI